MGLVVVESIIIMGNSNDNSDRTNTRVEKEKEKEGIRVKEEASITEAFDFGRVGKQLPKLITMYNGGQTPGRTSREKSLNFVIINNYECEYEYEYEYEYVDLELVKQVKDKERKERKS